jgi:cytochrome c5
LVLLVIVKVTLKISVLAALLACATGPSRRPLADGERLYLSRCTSCHRTYEPPELTGAQWGEAVAKMERLKKVRLSGEERALLLGWLQESAGR